MRKCSYLKVGNAVKCGTKEELFFTDRHYVIEKDGIEFRLRPLGDKARENDAVFTSVMNAVYWKYADELVEEKAEPEVKRGPGRPKGA